MKETLGHSFINEPHIRIHYPWFLGSVPNPAATHMRDAAQVSQTCFKNIYDNIYILFYIYILYIYIL